MVANSIVLGIGITTLFLFTMGTMLPTSRVFAADINCANVVTFCFGTSGDDRMAGSNRIDGNGGNDQISGSGQPDYLCGNAGDDKISGGDGGDTIVGDKGKSCLAQGGSTGGTPGADIMSGGARDDFIVHGDFIGNNDDDKKSDGHRDIIDCGSGGADTAVINISVDHDVATNCELVIAG